MAWQFQPYLLLLISTVIIALTVSLTCWRRRNAPGAQAYALLMAAVAWWAAWRALEGAAVSYDIKLTFGKLTYIGIASVAPLWLMAAVSYCGLDRWLTRSRVIVLWIIPALTMLFAVTNDWQRWLWSDVIPALNSPEGNLVYLRGWWWYLSVAYNYVLLLVGSILLVRHALLMEHGLRRQAVLLVTAVAVPWAANILNLLHIEVVRGFDLTPFALAISGAILAWGVFRFHLFDLLPLAHSAIIDDLQDAIVVIDNRRRVLDMNRAALRLVGLSHSPIGRSIDEVLAPWEQEINRYRDIPLVDGQVLLWPTEDSPRYLELRITPLRDRREAVVGRIITARDVTDRHQADVQLRQLQRAVEQSPASVVITDIAGKIEYVNPHFTQLTGYTLEEAIGQSPSILKTGHTPRAVYADLWTNILLGREWHGEFLNRKKNGELYWEDAHIGPVLDSTGNVTHFVAVKEDVTARKQTEEELQQSRARLKAIFDAAAVGITLTDRAGNYVQVNRRWSEMIGYSIEQLAQLSPIELTYPDDRAANEAHMRRLIDGTLDAYELEKRYVRADGSIFWGALSVTAIRSDTGEFEASLGVISDITERKAAVASLQELTAEMRGVIDTSRDGILLVTEDARLSVINAVFLHVLNLPGRPQDWRGKTAAALLWALRRSSPEAARAGAETLRQIRHAAQRQPAPREIEVAGRTLLLQALPVQSGDVAMGWLLTMRDLTDERVLEQMREDMRHTMVHDLRNPLSGISTALDVLADEPELLQPHQLQLVNIARRNSQRMINLVNDILDVSRLESGQMPLNQHCWPLPELIADALQEQQVLAQDKCIVLRSQIAADVPLVYADEGLMRRVFQNLVGNAVKFTPPGGCVTLTAELTTMISTQPIVLVSVRDTGPGIPPEIQSQLFQKFVTGSQKGRGSGLGLAFCKLAVEAHGQQIWADSAPGQGTAFTFTVATAR